MNHRDCRMCQLISNPFFFGEGRVCDAPFADTPSFVVIPALGPLALGHCMIVSKRHSTSLLTMNDEQKVEFLQLCNWMQSKWVDAPLVFAEHGSSQETGAGPCICHTHVNVIPLNQPSLLNLETHGQSLISSGELRQLPSVTDSYFLIGDGDIWRCYDSLNMPSQHLRMVLHAHYGLTHWDWRLFPNEGLAEETHRAWSERLGVSSE
jgi:diadenosine tetraphosphate (Ap4A) HIT family hydrolase